jgi:hypothetical protein
MHKRKTEMNQTLFMINKDEQERKNTRKFIQNKQNYQSYQGHQ